ncbi:M56 family metallopeptidase [Streptomyces sp. GMY02]|uniref:M56 family metallopeptidase n=1 Tax=Streptomyces sp. GMY02 TaxID=1333528 RepID=UPI001C2C1607|nr:M56 family metallopeptidase [Streptomyces sp. GMY02]QXE38373.1 M56 family metallopeptidase [Streptomyces sp. GMY02]
MIYLVWVPLLMPFLAVPAARRVAAALAPRHAAWLLTAVALVLAASSSAALALLVVPGASYLPVVAVLGELLEPLKAGPPVVAVALALVAGALLVWRTGVLAVAAHRGRAELRRARAAAGGTDGELAVLRDARPDAYALPGRPGRIVVTTGMLRALEPAEREALFAHERAHLRGRHHLFLTAVELASLCHPALRALCEPLRYALERTADEAAAAAVGDRRLAARAIGRAALAAREDRDRARPRAVLAATAGPVPRRVAALLGGSGGASGPGLPSRTGRLIAGALLCCVVLSGATAVGAADDLHDHIEIAQGESAAD